VLNTGDRFRWSFRRRIGAREISGRRTARSALHRIRLSRAATASRNHGSVTRTPRRSYLWSRRRQLGGRFVKATMTPAPMSLFNLLKLLALFVCEIGSHLPVRLSHGLMHAPAGLSLNVSELYRCLVDNRRDFGNLFRRQVQLSAEPFLHTRTDLFGMMKSKKKMPGI